MKWHYDHVEWGRYTNLITGREDYQFYLYWWPNFLPPDHRHLGIIRMWVDGPHVAFGFWWFNISWSAMSSLPPPEFCSDETARKWANKPLLIQKLWGMEAA